MTLFRCKCGRVHRSEQAVQLCRCGRQNESPQVDRDGYHLIPCRHRGDSTGEFVACAGCARNQEIYSCALFEKCTPHRPIRARQKWEGAVCITCDRREP